MLLTASASGTISAYLLATSPEPAWTHSSPQCITHHGSITAVRSEVRQASASFLGACHRAGTTNSDR